ncbi:MAG: NUDIX hydrolase [Candidatus Gottesmanbacteria bacterium GW2011_GWA1_34_13]|uniref:NUDIX hydrolase n=1 Tax=Candidatus Gottesmanbacteria bacterium GW2011_GWA1_34_13 TaxID=1618434 RepID=A0A0G0DSP4_9BACT|nr:MAG: NUDIX hydrolase [Candidatus Gottesmanbacteria bacterium GW2011_GWA1_34_13]
MEGKANKTMEKTYPQPVVGAFIVNRQNQLLLIKSHKWGGVMWSVPGGRVEVGETIKHAVEREILEEVGLKAKLVKVFAVFDAINPKNFFRKAHFIFLECYCKTENNNFQLDQKEIQEAKWFDLEKLKNLNIEPFTQKAINELKKNL